MNPATSSSACWSPRSRIGRSALRPHEQRTRIHAPACVQSGMSRMGGSAGTNGTKAERQDQIRVVGIELMPCWHLSDLDTSGLEAIDMRHAKVSGAVFALAVALASGSASAQQYLNYGSPYFGNQSASAGLGFVNLGRVDGPSGPEAAPCVTLGRLEASGSLTKLAAARYMEQVEPAADISACPSRLR